MRDIHFIFGGGWGLVYVDKVLWDYGTEWQNPRDVITLLELAGAFPKESDLWQITDHSDQDDGPVSDLMNDAKYPEPHDYYNISMRAAKMLEDHYAGV